MNQTSQLDLLGYQYQIQVSKNRNYVLASPKGDEVKVVSVNDGSAASSWFILPISGTQGQFNIFLNDGNFSYNRTSHTVDKGTFLNYQGRTVNLKTYPESDLYVWNMDDPSSGDAINWGAPKGKTATVCILTAPDNHLLFPIAYSSNQNAANPSGALYVDGSDDYLTSQDFTQWYMSSSPV